MTSVPLSMVPEQPIAGWSGRCPARTRVLPLTASTLPASAAESATLWIPRGGGNSFSDCAYISKGLTFSSQGMDRILEVDPDRGLVLCEAGVTNQDLFEFLERPELQAWTLPIPGGTGHVTVGGASAGDIHGKNHPAQGSYGNHVQAMQVLTASGHKVWCSEDENRDLFRATLGGMGLTGFICKVRLQLVPLPAPALHVQTRPIPDAMTGTFRLFDEEPAELQMAWLDLASRRTRGVFHFSRPTARPPRPPRRILRLPIPRIAFLNPWTAPWINRVIYRLHSHLDLVVRPREAHHPLDAIPEFQKAYGPRGFVEYQFLVPLEQAERGLQSLVEAARKTPAFHCVVKRFGPHPPAGLLSFAREGFTFTALFAARSGVFDVLDELTESLISMGANFNLTKDICMRSRHLEKTQVHLEEWRQIVRRWDPEGRIQSNLSRRLRLKPW